MPETAGDLTERLHEITLDLNGYIARRAEELAEPLIKAAQDAAMRSIAERQAEVQRQADLVAELRRRIRPLDQTRDKYLRLRETAHRVLRTYPAGPSDALRAALADLQEAADA